MFKILYGSFFIEIWLFHSKEKKGNIFFRADFPVYVPLLVEGWLIAFGHDRSAFFPEPS